MSFTNGPADNIPSFGGSGGSFNLDLGEGTTGGLGGFQIIPEGTHLFQVVDQRVEYSKPSPPGAAKKKYQEPMIVLTVKVVRASVPEAMGMPKDEYIVLPGEERKGEDYETWQKMMRMLRVKLEALTARPWREDNIGLNPQDLVGCFFVAYSQHKSNVYKDKAGNQQVGKNAELNNWQAVHANSPQQTSNGPQTVGQQVQQTEQVQAQQAQPVQQAQTAVPVSIGFEGPVTPKNPDALLGPWTPGEEPF